MPDVGMADYQMSRQHRIIAACEKWWPLEGPNGKLNYSDCSGFVASVASELGVPLSGNANAMYAAIQKEGWSILGHGDSAAHLAAASARCGMFVVGAWKNANGANGHVSIIVDTNYSSKTPAYQKRAVAYWGHLDSVGQKYALHSQSWGANKRPHVLYSAHQISQT